MKLYNGLSPNGIRVAVYLEEKGLTVPTHEMNIMEGETQHESFLEVNPLGEVPVLILDDGQTVTESIAICRYLEAMQPEPALFGRSPTELAFVEMWNRRIELRIFDVVGHIVRHELPLFRDRVEQMPDFGASQRRLLSERLAWLDGELADGRQFLAGNDFSVADITGMGALLLFRFASVDIPPALGNLKKWEATVCSRKSCPPMVAAGVA